MIDNLVDLPWLKVTPQELAVLLAQLDAPWWIAGGYALDLYLGFTSRPHGDIEIACGRADLQHVFDALPGFEFFAANNGTLRPLHDAGDLRDEEHGLWVRRVDTKLWHLEVLVEHLVGDRWFFRRDAKVFELLKDVLSLSEDGIPFMRPEVQLLYKARAARAKDVADLETVLPYLDTPSRAWLKKSLQITEPQHSWISLIDAVR